MYRLFVVSDKKTLYAFIYKALVVVSESEDFGKINNNQAISAHYGVNEAKTVNIRFVFDVFTPLKSISLWIFVKTLRISDM